MRGTKNTHKCSCGSPLGSFCLIPKTRITGQILGLLNCIDLSHDRSRACSPSTMVTIKTIMNKANTPESMSMCKVWTLNFINWCGHIVRRFIFTPLSGWKRLWGRRFRRRPFYCPLAGGPNTCWCWPPSLWAQRRPSSARKANPVCVASTAVSEA